MSMKEIVQGFPALWAEGNRWPSIPLVAANTVTGVNEWIAEHFGVPRLFGREMVAKLTEETVSDPSLLFSLGFRPAYGFDKGMEETVQWYKRLAR